ncbi:MAG: hypothetical protein Q8N88_03645 [Nanoarchaeota archaeon]|nr:hypothetical protein [Nanoarchaeota archaeon]
MRLKEWGVELLSNSLDGINYLAFSIFKTLPSRIHMVNESYYPLIYIFAVLFLIISVFMDGLDRFQGRKDIDNMVMKYLNEGSMVIFYITIIPSSWAALILLGKTFDKGIKELIDANAVLASFQGGMVASFPDTLVLGALFVLIAGIIGLILTVMAWLVFYELIYLYLIGPLVMVKAFHDHSRLMHYYIEVAYRLMIPGMYMLGFKISTMVMLTDNPIVAPISGIVGLLSILFLPGNIRKWLLDGAGSQAGKDMKEMGRFASLGSLTK